jgi:CRISPR-associated protein Cmr1
MDVTELEADFRVVTPLFMGGAYPEKPELRVPGIKGTLRFWWRALAYSNLNGDLKEIKKVEGQFFGSTKHGQSRVFMDISQKKQEPNSDIFFRGRNGLMYLGYGPIEKGNIVRKYLKPPIDATLNIRMITKDEDDRALVDSEIAEKISHALITMGLFGGLGSRSRRGFGSFNILDLRRDSKSILKQPRGVEDLKEQIRTSLNEIKCFNDLPEYTAFSSETAVYVYRDEFIDPLELLDRIGRMMLEYRAGIRGHPSKFKPDTDLAKKALYERVDRHPERIFFGLPHNYHFPKRQLTLDVIPVSPNRERSHDRRASPLFIHIQELRNGKYAAVATLIPAVFLPEDDRIFMKRQKSPESPESEVQVDVEGARSLKVIRDFLDSDSKWEKVIPA